ncbi:hypothetical protein [Bartonella sp. HY406]|uniref:hypothetical protein n=1 Tax=Bartonella sp. HY406 TaxID=2979331 RepID=UPI0021C7160F|nr:hypothetical protein [Bartonella sp. HY406]UXN02250.1 hypothetical protein N6B01_06990 [Bartonella sp. HY406]
MESNILTLKATLMQPIDEFLKINNLPDRFILDRYLLWGGNEGEFNTEPFHVSYNAIGWNENPPFGYIIELLDLNSLTLPMAKSITLSVEDNCLTEIILRLCYDNYLDDIKAMTNMIDISFRKAGYQLKESQKKMTEDSFAADRPEGSLTYSKWEIAGKQDKCRYILQVNETDSYSDPKKYSLVFKAQVITETMRQTFEARKAYRLEMQKKMNENLPKN